MTKRLQGIPDFLVIGAGKCGTTSLDNYLGQHPQLFVPALKEPNFFGYELRRPEEFADDRQELEHYLDSVTTLDAYLKLFDGAQTVQLKGETSNTYLYHEAAAERIKYYNDEMKLVAILRHPADRLWSRFLHLAREGKLPSNDFTDCFNKNSIWWKRGDLVKEGFYYRNLSRYYKLFPADQIMVCLYDDFVKKPQEVLSAIFEFLDVDPNFEPNISVHYNGSGFVKNKGLDLIIGNHGILPRVSKKVLRKDVFEKLKKSNSLQRIVTRVREINLRKPKLDPNVRSTIFRTFYEQDVVKLEGLIGKNLSSWRN